MTKTEPQQPRLTVCIDLNKSRQDIAEGTQVAFIDAEGRLCFGVAVETFKTFVNDPRRVKVKRPDGTHCSPTIERVAVL